MNSSIVQYLCIDSKNVYVDSFELSEYTITSSVNKDGSIYLAKYVHLLFPIHDCIMHNCLELPVWCWKAVVREYLSLFLIIKFLTVSIVLGVGFLLISLVKLRKMFTVFILDGCCCAMLRSFSRVRLCNPRDCSPPGSSVHGLLQARILAWVAILDSVKCFAFLYLLI